MGERLLLLMQKCRATYLVAYLRSFLGMIRRTDVAACIVSHTHNLHFSFSSPCEHLKRLVGQYSTFSVEFVKYLRLVTDIIASNLERLDVKLWMMFAFWLNLQMNREAQADGVWLIRSISPLHAISTECSERCYIVRIFSLDC